MACRPTALAVPSCPSTLLVFLGLACAACGASRAPGQLTMPHPEGCYVEVFDAPKFGGMHNFINGPSKHRSLANLPGGGNWDARIRSLKVGPGALVRAWAAEDFAGVSLRATPEQQQADLSDGFDRKIQSLQVECRTAAAAPGIR